MAGGLRQRRAQATKGGRKDGDGAAAGAEDKPRAATAGSGRSLTIAIGGVLTLLGVATYTFSRRAGLEVPHTPAAAQTPLESVEAKRTAARAALDGLPAAQRRERAKQVGLLTDDEVDAILHAHESSWALPVRGGGGIAQLRVDTNQVSSNSPIEDYLAWAPLRPDAEGGAPRYMFGVFDGHAGHACAEQLAARMAPMLNETLEIVGRGQAAKDAPLLEHSPSRELVRTVRELERGSGPGWDRVPLALTAAFVRMDDELVHGALGEFRRAQDLGRMDALLGPAVAGSCGLVAVVDAAAGEVVVANTGDSRALLGVRLGDGRWKAVRLSEDQTAKNRNEAARLTREHPGEPAVIRGGRVLGALMPTRAFGDCRYKWPLEAQQDLFPVLYARGHRYATTPPDYASPPYVTAKPVIVKHKLGANDKFIVIASDGLYDQLSDAEVVDTVAQWFEANAAANATAAATVTSEPAPLTTQDANAATHLVRAALSTDRLGRRSDAVIRRLLAIPPPHSRRFRDDISVTVVSLL
ncbi:hypothetical protein H4R18_003797 [Coemansia javaensis]|uniref:PPM-type phosphatase domain-containing protein n=1 Tax=Coemansia javaensis TaxID=2761396 RepID=A0A9W8HCM7_9FUNG|nr:hypothetical protein H4R18_003797 [Coemansia javaensis]